MFYYKIAFQLGETVESWFISTFMNESDKRVWVKADEAMRRPKKKTKQRC